MSDEIQPLALDPFGFLIGVASRVPGLGGPTPGHDPTYVFHVPYVAAARGPANFTIVFDNLRARNGTLTLRVHMLPEEPGATARLVNSTRIQLNRLVKERGRISIGFDGYRGVTYAVMGMILDQTDIQADAIHVELDRPANNEAMGQSFVDARSTTFGSDQVRPSAHMLSAKNPSMRFPVSQPYGATQMREAVTGDWLERAGLRPDGSAAQWQLVYKLQVLEAYGMLQAGVRALGFTRGDDAFVGVLEAAGLSTAVAAPGSEAVVAAMDPLYPPADLVNFDVVWASDPGTELADAADISRFVENAMACLRPGGLAVFVFATTEERTVERDPDDRRDVLMTRIELERIALMLISRRHEVAQLKPMGIVDGIADAEGGNLFGLIARKPRSAL